MIRVAISGYASLDHVIALEGTPSADRTTLIRTRSEDGWGRLGGSPSYVGRALAAEGVDSVAAISWVGDDAQGQSYRDMLARDGLDVAGVEARGGRTPIAILAYEPGGGCICLYDPGLFGDADLSASQRAIVAAADWICVTVGPPVATRSVLASARREARLLWAVKHDPRSAPPDLVALLAARADVVSLARGEADFVAAALAAAPPRERLVVETLGAEGARLTYGGRSALVAGEKLAVADPTGAGDTFIGGLIAGLIDRPGDPVAAVERGAKAARRMLLARQAGRLSAEDTLEKE